MNTFTWCRENRHTVCKRQYQRFIVDNKTNKVVWLDEFVHCVCPKRGCECYLPVKDRPKAKQKTNRRKK